ncbi:MAG: cupredoxin domain-containing protein [Patescibacteria group bacterium]
MIDIAPPENLPRRIPPRELIKQKIAESELSGNLESSETKEMRSLSSKSPSPSAPQSLPKKPSHIGLILGFIFVFLLILGLFIALGILYLQTNSLKAKISELSQATQLSPQELETQKTKLENLEKELADLKKAEAEKINSLEDKINKISQTQAAPADTESIKQLEMILKLTDTDNDGLSDYDEVVTYNTNPNLKDTDGDKYLDKVEIDNGYNPLGSGKLEKTAVSEEQKIITIIAKNYIFDPAQFEVKTGEKATLEITSQDADHTFTIDELDINQTIKAGEKATIEFTPQKTGEYIYYSNTIEDKGKGMMGKLVVK